MAAESTGVGGAFAGVAAAVATGGVRLAVLQALINTDRRSEVRCTTIMY
jgi:hypothetical protein